MNVAISNMLRSDCALLSFHHALKATKSKFIVTANLSSTPKTFKGSGLFFNKILDPEYGWVENGT